MNVLILGGGGREHAISWKIAQSSICKKLLIAPGNPGTAEVGNNIEIDITDFNAIKKLALYEKIDLIIVGPEDPLVNGIFDFLKEDPQTNNIIIVGPSKKGAQLEGSKEFAKKLLNLGCYISISGIVTFKNSNDLVEAISFIPNDKLLVETDSPYLSPAPHRGKTNEPSFITHTIEKLSIIKNTDKKIIIENTTNNFKKLFNLK